MHIVNQFEMNTPNSNFASHGRNDDKMQAHQDIYETIEIMNEHDLKVNLYFTHLIRS